MPDMTSRRGTDRLGKNNEYIIHKDVCRKSDAWNTFSFKKGCMKNEIAAMRTLEDMTILMYESFTWERDTINTKCQFSINWKFIEIDIFIRCPSLLPESSKNNNINSFSLQDNSNDIENSKV